MTSEDDIKEKEHILAYNRRLAEMLQENDSGITEEDIAVREECEGSLLAFAKHAWHVLEPASREMLVGWALEGMAEHLEAVSDGDLTKLLINISPGSMKSLLTRVFWPAWEWGPRKDTWIRYLYASYDQKLAIRDAKKMRELILSDWYQKLWPHVKLTTYQAEKANFQNTDNGFVMSLSVGGRTTGERGDRVLVDDPHNVTDAESDVIRQGTVEWFREAIPMRLNDFDKSAIVVIMQRVHEDDVSGHILSSKSLKYEHLCIPLYYDPQRHCSTSIGWSDPRTIEGENFWPERYTEAFLEELTSDMGRFAVAAQLQQMPSPKGGGIIKRKWWQLWDEKYFPPFEYIVAAADTAYTEATENDPSAVTVWGLYRDIHDVPKIMLMYAWAGRVQLHELVYEIAKICNKYKVDKLLIEGKASGISVSQEIHRLFADRTWGTQLINPKGDKVARLMSIEHLFSGDILKKAEGKNEEITSGGLIFAPDKEWAEMVIAEVEKFPKGKHDDLVDTVSMSLRFLRDNGLAIRRDEKDRDLEDRTEFRGTKLPLYDC